MSEKNYNRQAAKRQRISKATLIVGMDVDKAFNAVGIGWGFLYSYKIFP